MKSPLPVSPTTLARLHLLERILLPVPDYSAAALFTALRAPAAGPADDDPAAQFTRLVAEEWRRLPPGSLVAPDFEPAYPGSRADAHLVAQELGRHTNPVAQFLAYLPALCRYLQPGCWRSFTATPTARDWAAALTPDRPERAALRVALHQGWLTAAQGQRVLEPERRIAALPGQDGDCAELVPEIMGTYYRQQAERHLRQALPMPLRAEIFLDVGSATADPLTTPSPLTLAALVAATAVIRAGGRVRVQLFADASVQLRHWCGSERTVARFLMHYLGGGSVFPAAAPRRPDGPQRIILADGACDVTAAVRAAPGCVLLLHAADQHRAARYRRLGAHVTTVPDLHDLPARVVGALTAAVAVPV